MKAFLLVSAPFLVLAHTASGQTPCTILKLQASDAAVGDLFGQTLAISGDTAVVGVPLDDDLGTSTGAAYVFRRSSVGDWMQTVKLLPAGAAAGDQIGYSVSISGDRIAIGSPFDDDAGFNSGAVFVYEQSGPGWTLVDKLVASDGAANDEFGGAVALSGDYLVAGAGKDDDAGTDSGSAYVFRRNAQGAWNQVDKLAASDGAAFDAFGSAVALSDATAVIGAKAEEDPGFQDSGAAYVYEIGPFGWTQTFKLTAGDQGSFDNFGLCVAIDGETAVIGSPLDDIVAANAGSAYVFRREATASWSQTAKLSATVGQNDDQLGCSVAILGSTIAVGSRFNEVPPAVGSNHGSLSLYVLGGSGWALAGELTASDGSTSDELGSSVGLASFGVLSGAIGDDDLGTNSGSVYAFEFTDDQPLTGCPNKISLAAGGTQSLRLNAGAEHANQLYFVLGSVTGTSPGLPVESFLVPLNVDGYFLYTLGNPNHYPLSNSLGVLSATGTSLTQFALPAGADATLAGITAHHAAVVLPLFTLSPVQFVSNAAQLKLVP